MTLTQTGLRVVAGTILVGIVLAGCGGRLAARGADAVDSDAGPVAATASPSDAIAAGHASAEPSPLAEPSASATPAASAAPKSTPTSTPVPTPDLDALDQLINQLDAALAADATSTTDEGSPQ